MARITLRPQTNRLSLVSLCKTGQTGGGGGGGGGGATATTSWIQMAVDPTLGTSPPAGTVVRNQMEYDALGYDLLYAQDALDILPTTLRHGIVVTLRAGTHVGKPGRTGVTGYDPWLFTPNFQVDSAEAYWESPGDGRALGIYFEGEGTTNIGGPIAGSWNGYNFTRSAGTWTVDAESGRLLLVTSGYTAGSIYPIYGNDAAKLDMYMAISSPQAMTVQIYTPTTVVNPGDYQSLVVQADSYYTIRPAGFELKFKNLFFDNASDELSWYGRVTIESCMLNIWGLFLRYTALATPTQHSSVLSPIFQSALRLHPAGGGGLRIAGGGVSLYQVTIRGECQGEDGSGSLITLMSDDWSLLGDMRIGPLYEAVPSISGALIFIERGNAQAGTFTVIEGNGLTTGIVVRGTGGLYAYDDTVTGWVLRNHSVGVRVASHNAIHASGFRTQCSGNAVGWQIDKGARVVSFDPQNVGATTAIVIDGQAETYASLAAPGDSVIGPYGSELLRRA